MTRTEALAAALHRIHPGPRPWPGGLTDDEMADHVLAALDGWTLVPIAAPAEGLTFAGFAATNRARCEAPDGFGHPVSGWSLSDWMLAATGEFGEAANVAKKLNRVRDGIPGNTQTPEELRAALADEFADAVIYLDLAAQSQGIDLGTAVASKFNRTSEKIGAPHRIAQPAAPAEGLPCGCCLDGDGSLWTCDVHTPAAPAEQVPPVAGVERPFPCSCGRSFQRAADLGQHRAHNPGPHADRRMSPAPAEGLDVERLAPVLDAHYDEHAMSDEDGHCDRLCAAAIAREYAALEANHE